MREFSVVSIYPAGFRDNTNYEIERESTKEM